MNKPAELKIFSPTDLMEIAQGISFNLNVPPSSISISQGKNRLLTVRIYDHEFTGTLDEVWAWVDTLKDKVLADVAQTEEPDSDFEP